MSIVKFRSPLALPTYPFFEQFVEWSKINTNQEKYNTLFQTFWDGSFTKEDAERAPELVHEKIAEGYYPHHMAILAMHFNKDVEDNSVFEKCLSDFYALCLESSKEDASRNVVLPIPPGEDVKLAMAFGTPGLVRFIVEAFDLYDSHDYYATPMAPPVAQAVLYSRWDNMRAFNKLMAESHLKTNPGSNRIEEVMKNEMRNPFNGMQSAKMAALCNNWEYFRSYLGIDIEKGTMEDGEPLSPARKAVVISLLLPSPGCLGIFPRNSAYSIALFYGNYEMAETLMDFMGKIPELRKTFFDTTCNNKMFTRVWKTPFEWTVMFGTPELCKKMLREYSPPGKSEVKDYYFCTDLHNMPFDWSVEGTSMGGILSALAFVCGNFPVAEYILENVPRNYATKYHYPTIICESVFHEAFAQGYSRFVYFFRQTMPKRYATYIYRHSILAGWGKHRFRHEDVFTMHNVATILNSHVISRMSDASDLKTVRDTCAECNVGDGFSKEAVATWKDTPFSKRPEYFMGENEKTMSTVSEEDLKTEYHILVLEANLSSQRHHFKDMSILFPLFSSKIELETRIHGEKDAEQCFYPLFPTFSGDDFKILVEKWHRHSIAGPSTVVSTN